MSSDVREQPGPRLPPALARLFVQLAAPWGRVRGTKRKDLQPVDSSVAILLYVRFLILTGFLEPAEAIHSSVLPRRASL